MLLGNSFGRQTFASGEPKPENNAFEDSFLLSPQNSQTRADSKPYADLLNAVWCPICGCKLTVQKKDGKKTLHCSQHGEMKVFLDKDPKAGGEN